MSKRFKITLGVAAIVLVLCGLISVLAGVVAWSSPDSTAATVRQAAAPTTTKPTIDPYAVYLANNPKPKFILSREDAQTRAYLGCGYTFAPGTIDAALASAYRPTGICG